MTRSEENEKASDELDEIYNGQMDLVSRLAEFRAAHPLGRRLDVGIVAIAELMGKAFAWIAAYKEAHENTSEGHCGDTVGDMISAAKSNGGGVGSPCLQLFEDEISLNNNAGLSDQISAATMDYNAIKAKDIMECAGWIAKSWLESHKEEE